MPILNHRQKSSWHFQECQDKDKTLQTRNPTYLAYQEHTYRSPIIWDVVAQTLTGLLVFWEMCINLMDCRFNRIPQVWIVKEGAHICVFLSKYNIAPSSNSQSIYKRYGATLLDYARAPIQCRESCTPL